MANTSCPFIHWWWPCTCRRSPAEIKNFFVSLVELKLQFGLVRLRINPRRCEAWSELDEVTREKLSNTWQRSDRTSVGRFCDRHEVKPKRKFDSVRGLVDRNFRTVRPRFSIQFSISSPVIVRNRRIEPKFCLLNLSIHYIIRMDFRKDAPLFFDSRSRPLPVSVEVSEIRFAKPPQSPSSDNKEPFPWPNPTSETPKDRSGSEENNWISCKKPTATCVALCAKKVRPVDRRFRKRCRRLQIHLAVLRGRPDLSFIDPDLPESSASEQDCWRHELPTFGMTGPACLLDNFVKDGDGLKSCSFAGTIDV